MAAALVSSCARPRLIFQHGSAFQWRATLTPVSLVRNDCFSFDPVLLYATRSAVTAYKFLAVHVMTPVGVVVDPRQENAINFLGQVDILFVVPLHYCPRFRAPIHTVMPKGHAHMFCLGA